MLLLTTGRIFVLQNDKIIHKGLINFNECSTQKLPVKISSDKKQDLFIT